MADVPEVGKVPLGPHANEPASGSYGEGAAASSLEAQLPTMPPPGPSAAPPSGPQISPNPISIGGGPGPGRPDTGGAAAPAGIPSAILEAGLPSGPPMAPLQDPLAGAANAAQGRVVVLQQLANSPDVSATTREWAQTVLKTLLAH